MKKICTALFFTLGIGYVAFSQTKLEQLQGIWENIMSNPNGEMLIKIVKNNNVLSIAHQGEDYIDFYLDESIDGFVNVDSFDIITLDSLKENGLYYISVSKRNVKSKKIHKEDCILGWNLYFEEGNLIIEGGKLAEYSHLDRLPSLTMRLLYKRGKKDNRNYLKEYLNTDFKEVITTKSIIYSEPDLPTKMYLIKSDVVTVLEEKEGWLKIEYEGKKAVTGWIKKEDTSK